MDLASRALAVLFLLPFLAAASQADIWTYFYPEYVESISCKVSPVVMQHGRESTEQHEVWLATATAERPKLRPEMQHWSTWVDEEPYNDKGLMRATKKCGEWTKEARKRMSAAAPIRVNQKEKK